MNIDKKEFDKRREAENWLYNYKSIKAGIENLKEEHKVLSNNKSGVDTELDLLHNRIKTMQRKVEQIDRALNALSNIER